MQKYLQTCFVTFAPVRQITALSSDVTLEFQTVRAIIQGVLEHRNMEKLKFPVWALK